MNSNLLIRSTQIARLRRTAAVGASLALLISGCGKDEQAAGAMPMGRPPANVSTVAASTRDVPIYIDQIGRTLAMESVSIIPQVGGKIIATHIKDGAYVKKGDPLFDIDPRPFKASLAAAQAGLAQSKADQSLAKIEFQRAEGLVQSAAVSQLEFEQKRSAFEVAQAKVLSAEATIETAQLDLEYAKIFSPIDGRAGARLVDTGNVVKENEGAMLVIQKLDPIYVEFTITEGELSTVRRFAAAIGRTWGDDPGRGLKVEVDIPDSDKNLKAALGSIRPSTAPSTEPSMNPSAPSMTPAAVASSSAPATAPVTDAPGATTAPAERVGVREGQLTFLDNSVQGGSGTVKLRATVPNADRYFWPGQFVTVRVILTTKKDAVVVPVLAQQIGQQGPFVYVVRQSEVENPQTKAKETATVAEARPIVPGQRQGDWMVIEKGVEAGDQVVVSGQMMVMPGAKVNVVPAAPAGTQANAAH